MLQELWTNDFAIYTVEQRKVIDDFTLRKSQHDRRKLRKFLNALLLEKEIMFWYNDDSGKEKTVIGTLKNQDYRKLLDAPIVIEKYRKRSYLEFYHLRFFQCPSRIPMNLHLDSITKFVLSTENLSELMVEISNKT